MCRDGYSEEGRIQRRSTDSKEKGQIPRKRNGYQGEGTDTNEKERIPRRRNGYQDEGKKIKEKGRDTKE